MGSRSLVTTELTSPISQCPRKQRSESLLLRLKHFTMFESPKMQRAGQRPVSWVNIPITRTVNNMMANVVEELQQQQQQQQHHQSPKRVRWSEELTQVRDISPRYKASPFRFISPNRNNNNNRSQRSASPSRSSSVSTSSSSRPSKSSIEVTSKHHINNTTALLSTTSESR